MVADSDYFDRNSEPVRERITTGLNKIGLAMKHQAGHLARQDGLSPTQGQILAALVGAGSLSGSELSDRLGVTLPTISDSVRVLAAKGLVAKLPDSRHPRASLISVTQHGKELGDRARAWPEFLAEAVGTLSEQEQSAFLAGISKMIRTLQDEGLVPVSSMCLSCKHFRPNAWPGPKKHHCAFVDAPMADDHLRLDCSDHEPAGDRTRSRIWEEFIQPV